MLHGIIYEQGNCLDVNDDISEKMNIFHMFSYKSLCSGALILGIIVIADSKSRTCVTDVTYFLMCIILKCTEQKKITLIQSVISPPIPILCKNKSYQMNVCLTLSRSV